MSPEDVNLILFLFEMRSQQEDKGKSLPLKAKENLQELSLELGVLLLKSLTFEESSELALLYLQKWFESWDASDLQAGLLSLQTTVKKMRDKTLSEENKAILDWFLSPDTSAQR